jgi:hypothetical protein
MSREKLPTVFCHYCSDMLNTVLQTPWYHTKSANSGLEHNFYNYSVLNFITRVFVPVMLPACCIQVPLPVKFLTSG